MFEIEIYDDKYHLPFKSFYTLSCQPDVVWTSLSYFIYIVTIEPQVKTLRLSGRQEVTECTGPSCLRAQEGLGGGRLKGLDSVKSFNKN